MTILRRLIIIAGIAGISLAVYHYFNDQTALTVVIGPISAMLTAIGSALEYKDFKTKTNNRIVTQNANENSFNFYAEKNISVDMKKNEGEK